MAELRGNGHQRSKYRAGQRWAYRSRPSEPDSTLTICRVELRGGLVVAHLFVERIAIENRGVDGGVQRDIVFVPITEAALDDSVTRLVECVAVEQHPLWGEHEQAYRDWRASSESGFFTVPVAKVVQLLDDTLRGKYPRTR